MEKQEERCSFCGKEKSEVKHLVQGVQPRAFICDRCALAAKTLLKEDTEKKKESEPVKPAKSNILPMFPDPGPQGA